MNTQNAQLAGALVGLGATITQAMDQIDDFVPCGHPASVVINGLAALDDSLTDDQRNEQVSSVTGLIDHVSEKRGVPAHDIANVLELGGIKTQLLDELKHLAIAMKPKTDTNPSVNAWMYRSLAAIERDGNLEAAARMAEIRAVKAAVETL